MSEKSLDVLGNICTTCVVAGLSVLAVATGATLLWVAYLQ